MFFTKKVSFKTAKKLSEAGFPQNIGHDWYDERGSIIDHLPLNEPCYNAPSYAEVFVYLFTQGVFIELVPWMTFALEEGMAFSYFIVYIDMNEPKLNRETWSDFASFGLAADTAIIRALEILKSRR